MKHHLLTLVQLKNLVLRFLRYSALKYLILVIILIKPFTFGIPHGMADQDNIIKMNKLYNSKQRYRNNSTAPTYLHIKFRDPKTGVILNMIVESISFAPFLAYQRGFTHEDPSRSIEFSDGYQEFIENEFVTYMIENEEKIIDFDLSAYVRFIGKRGYNGDERAARRYLTNWIFEKPLTIEDLDVKDASEFIDKYLDVELGVREDTVFFSIKEKYEKQYYSNPAFIALMINLGFYVGRGDVVPVLTIANLMKNRTGS